MKTPLVSIITVNYNTPEVTAAMLRSLTLLDYDNWEVIVVDNASPQYSSLPLIKEFPFIKHISAPTNIGFAGGNNIGLHFAKGDYILFLNNDTIVKPNLLTVLVNYLQIHPECGMACPKIKYFELPDTIQYAGTIGLHPLTSRSHNIGFLQKDNGQFNKSEQTDLPNGAAMMIPALLIKKIGAMSEMFFLYYEELDWAERFKKAHYQIHYVGTTEILHKESISTGKNSPLKIFYLYRNRLLFIRRNYTGWKYIIASSFFTFISTPVHIIKHAINMEWKLSRSIINAFIWNLRHQPFKEPKIHSSTFVQQLSPDTL